MLEGTAHLDDIVLAIVRHLRDRSKTFTANREQLHRAFFALKQSFPEPLGDMTFRSKGFFPESRGLDQALANLEASGLLHRMNETPYFYEIDPEVEDSFEKYVKSRLECRGPAIEDTATMAHELATKLQHVPEESQV